MEQIEYFRAIQKIIKYLQMKMNSKIAYKKMKIFLNRLKLKIEKQAKRKQAKLSKKKVKIKLI